MLKFDPRMLLPDDEAPTGKTAILGRHYAEKDTVMEDVVYAGAPRKLVTSRFGTEHLAAAPACNLDTIKTSMKRVYLDDLEYKTHFGCYLVARAIVEPFKLCALCSVLEDERGSVLRFTLYNFISPLLMHEDVSWALANGQKLVILEPCRKFSASGATVIRCDNPSHIILLNDDHPFTRELSWKFPLPDYPASPPREECASLAEDFKTEGNDFFKSGKFCEAAASYSQALTILDSVPKRLKELRVKVLSNRSEALLKMGHDHLALRDASTAVVLDPRHGKSLIRKIRALIGLKRYTEAQAAVTSGLEAFSSGELLSELLWYNGQLERQLRPLDRVTEDDLAKLLEAASKQEEGNTRVLWPGYSKSLQVKRSKFARGRGTFAVDFIRQGEIVLAEKACAMVFSSDIERIVAQSSSAEGVVTSVRYDASENELEQLTVEKTELTWRVTMQACWRPEVNKTVQELAGLPETKSQANDSPAAACEHEDPTPLPISIENVETVCSRNVLQPDTIYGHRDSLGFAASARPTASDKSGRGMSRGAKIVKGAGLWRKAGLINHRCIPNCSHILVGDVLIVTALKDIQVDEELSINYALYSDSYTHRQAVVDSYGFRCVCKRCRREESHKVKYDRAVEKFYLIAEALATKKSSTSALLTSTRQLHKTVLSITPGKKESLLLGGILDLLLLIYIRRQEPGEALKTALALEEPLTCVEETSHWLPVHQTVLYTMHACTALAAARDSVPARQPMKSKLAAKTKEYARQGLRVAGLLLGNSDSLTRFVFGAEALKHLQETAAGVQ